jgi:hypothetical protein
MAGNFNQKHHLWRNVGIGAAVTGAALTRLGAAGIGWPRCFARRSAGLRLRPCSALTAR